jgi:hypothetical protein
MSGSKEYYKRLALIRQWEYMRQAAKGFRQAEDIDKFAQQHYKRFPNHPPDQFDRILWNRPKLERLYNRSSARWVRANKAGSSNGILTRLFKRLDIPIFITFPITEIGFSIKDGDYKNFHDKVLITEIKEALSEQIAGSAWFSLEVSRRKSIIHPHVLCEQNAYSFRAFAEPIYEPIDLYYYLIKGIPYNAENLAVFWRAKKALPDGKQLVRKTGTIRVPYFKN